MTCDYREIRRDNELRYGTDIGRIGPMLLADRYDDRTHFIYELLQNAEDALAKRGPWSGKRSVRFQLGSKSLRVSHFGKTRSMR
jgi:HSP90 family molecular chaperone